MDASAVLQKLRADGVINATLNNSVISKADADYMATFHSRIPSKIQFASYGAKFTLLVAYNGGNSWSPVHTFSGSGIFSLDVPPSTTQVDAKLGGITILDPTLGWVVTTF